MASEPIDSYAMRKNFERETRIKRLIDENEQNKQIISFSFPNQSGEKTLLEVKHEKKLDQSRVRHVS